MQRASRNVALFLAHVVRSAARMPAQLVMVPQDLRTADPTVAADIYAGHFVFALRNECGEIIVAHLLHVWVFKIFYLKSFSDDRRTRPVFRMARSAL